jgi:hypothetical protein
MLMVGTPHARGPGGRMATTLVAVERGSLWPLVARRALICLEQAAKEILAEIFRAWPEDMIQRRLTERSWCEGHEWPATFSQRSDHGLEL